MEMLSSLRRANKWSDARIHLLQIDPNSCKPICTTLSATSSFIIFLILKIRNQKKKLSSCKGNWSLSLGLKVYIIPLQNIHSHCLENWFSFNPIYIRYSIIKQLNLYLYSAGFSFILSLFHTWLWYKLDDIAEQWLTDSMMSFPHRIHMETCKQQKTPGILLGVLITQ